MYKCELPDHVDEITCKQGTKQIQAPGTRAVKIPIKRSQSWMGLMEKKPTDCARAPCRHWPNTVTPPALFITCKNQTNCKN